MTDFNLLIDLHKNNFRQGPGSDAMTQKALEATGLTPNKNLRIADIGCGTGAQTFVLAKQLGGQVTAVDVFPEFLEILHERAGEKELTKITTMAASMDELPFAQNSFDLIWSEGAVYNNQEDFEAYVRKTSLEFNHPIEIDFVKIEEKSK